MFLGQTLTFTPENLVDDSFWRYSNANGGWDDHNWSGQYHPPPPGITVYFDQNNSGYISQSDLTNSGLDWGVNVYDDYSNGGNWYSNHSLISSDLETYYARHDSHRFYQNLTLQPNTTYTFSFYHKHYYSGNSGFLQPYYKESSTNTEITGPHFETVGTDTPETLGNSPWKREVWTFTTSANGGYQIAVKDYSGTSHNFFYGVQLEQSSSASPIVTFTDYILMVTHLIGIQRHRSRSRH